MKSRPLGVSYDDGTKTVLIGATGATEASCNDYGDMLNVFFANWMVKRPLDQCIGVASSKSLHLPLPVPGNEVVTLSDGTVWDGTVWPKRSTSKLYIIGYTGLKRDGSN